MTRTLTTIRTQATTEGGDLIYDEDGKPVYTYVDKNGNPASGAQSIYVKYEVTSDIFLKSAPTKDQVTTMAANNDHVYFMDFPTYDAKGNEITHHAFYDPEATTFMQTGDLSKNKDKNTGNWVPEKKSYSGSAYTSDTSDPYNATQYRTADDRMVLRGRPIQAAGIQHCGRVEHGNHDRYQRP